MGERTRVCAYKLKRETEKWELISTDEYRITLIENFFCTITQRYMFIV